MVINSKKYILLFFIGAILAPIGDYGHVTSGTTEYFWAPGPMILKSPLWFVILVGCFTVSLGFLSSTLKKKINSDYSGKKADFRIMAASVAGTMLLYLTSSILPYRFPGIELLLMIIISIFIWNTTDGTLLSFCIGLTAALSGVLAEIILIYFGLYKYNSDYGTFFGVAPWLFAIFFSLGVSIVKIDEYYELKKADGL